MTDLEIRVREFVETFAALTWGPWLVALLVGGGLFLLVYSRALPYRRIADGVRALFPKEEASQEDLEGEGTQGQITSFEALCSAMAGTIGMGNLAGVAVALHEGGPGAIFWMWVSALIGMATKFFTGTLAVLYRKQGENGRLYAGPMHVIEMALGSWAKPLAVLFSIAGMVGCLPVLATNQFVTLVQDTVQGATLSNEAGSTSFVHPEWARYGAVSVAAVLVGIAAFGGIRKLGQLTSRIVPVMVGLYLVLLILIALRFYEHIPGVFSLIFRDAFTGEAVCGGALWLVISTGFRRAALSNEAGIGTEMMAYGMARTRRPVREGLVAMLGPVIDTGFVCTATAVVILIGERVSGVGGLEGSGIVLTQNAFQVTLGTLGFWGLFVCGSAFSVSTLLGYSYYSQNCFEHLFGEKRIVLFRVFYLSLVFLAAISPLETAIGLIDGCYALMAIPTMTATLLLAPKVMQAAKVEPSMGSL